MIRRLFPYTLALVMVVSIAIPSVAVSQTENENDDTTAEVNGLSLGRPVDDNDVGQTYIAETHGDWSLRCIRAAANEPEQCRMYQLLRDAEGNPTAEFYVFDIPDQDQVTGGATIVTPLATLLTGQMRVRIDDGQDFEFPFSFCQEIGCFVRIGLTPGELDRFRAGATAYIGIVPLSALDQRIELEASLRGFTAAFAALEERTARTLEFLEAAENADPAPQAPAQPAPSVPSLAE